MTFPSSRATRVAVLPLVLLAACADLPRDEPTRRSVTLDADALTRGPNFGDKPRSLQTAPLAESRLAAVVAAPPVAPAPPSVPVAPAPVPAPAAVPAPALAPLARMPGPADSVDAVRLATEALFAWRDAWERGDAEAYLRHYDAAFVPEGLTRAAWERQRRQRVAGSGITVRIDQLQVEPVGANEVDVRFVQQYAARQHRDTGEKRMRLRRGADGWRIVSETWKAR